jgi:hypothetical protein
MGSSEYTEDNLELAGGVGYYKSDLQPLPVIFVQRKRSWSSYTPGGETLEYCPGLIPENRLSGLEEIDQEEARRWLSAEYQQVTRSDGEVVLEKKPAGAVAVAPVTLKPRRWRQLVFGPAVWFVLLYVVFAIVATALALTSGSPEPEALPGAPLWQSLLFGLILLAFVLFVVTMSIFRGRLATYDLTVDATSLSAKAGFWRSRPSSILLREIDVAGSVRRGLFARLFGWQWLYSKHGARVMFYRRYFDPADARELLRCLGMQPS